MNRPRPIRRFLLSLPALLSIALAAASPAPGQETNTPGQPTTNVAGFEPKPAAAIGDETNPRQKYTPPSSNSIAFQETKARAEKGEAAAQSQLGLMYDLGQGVAQDHVEAVKWLRKAGQDYVLLPQFASPKYPPVLLGRDSGWKVLGEVIWWVGRPPK